jgi:hypothetical protein
MIHYNERGAAFAPLRRQRCNILGKARDIRRFQSEAA